MWRDSDVSSMAMEGCFLRALRSYIGLNESGNAAVNASNVAALLDQAKKLLTFRSNGDGDDFRLPPVLVTDLARRSQDAFFVLLIWLDRLRQDGHSSEILSNDDKRRIVGAITTLGWFALKPDKCLNALWNRLTDSTSQDFFSAGVLRNCLDLTDRREMPLIPPLPPVCLEAAVSIFLGSLPRFENGFWQTDWNWWRNFANTVGDIPSVAEWFQRYLPPNHDKLKKNICAEWVSRLASMPQRPSPLVLYGQRQWLAQWFPEYDPARPDQLEDTDRPWDMDHIHPTSNIYGKHGISQIIREWHGCMGNLRAWPLEANRERGADSPAQKLHVPIKREIDLGLHSGLQIREASCIEENYEWPLWKASTSDGSWRPALIEAITKRWIRLYEEWYNTLLIGTLFDDQGV